MYYDNQSIQCQQQMYHLQSNNGVFRCKCTHIVPLFTQRPIKAGSKYKHINVYLSSFQKILNV